VGTPVAQLIRILSASIAPVIVISGIGLLLLSMTNRYSRVIERARELIKDLDATKEKPAAQAVRGADTNYLPARAYSSPRHHLERSEHSVCRRYGPFAVYRPGYRSAG
jgi:hypothetical protein